MSFVQVIDCRTSRLDEIQALDREWGEAARGRSTLRRQIITADRNDPGHYMVFCFFDSYSAAMENSNLPETKAGSARYAELLDGPPAFHNLDGVEDRTLDEAGAAKPGFVQLMDIRSGRVEEIRGLDREYEAAISDRTTVRRSVVTQDRDNPDRWVIMVFFDSYSSAMKNSELPETSALAGKMAALLERPPTFYDLDVVEDRTV